MAKKKVIKTVTTTETIRKKTTHKKGSHKKISKENHPSDKQLEKVLVENFIMLQKVMTDHSLKLDKLTTNISELLELFEKSAETLAKKDFRIEQRTEGTEKVLEGIKNLSEQNKIIAKGLTLIHEHEKSKDQYEPSKSSEEYIPPQMNQMQPSQFQPQQRLDQSNIRRSSLEVDEYQNSISSKLQKLKQIPKE